MIEILTTAKQNNENITLFGALDEKERTITLKYHVVDAAFEMLREIIYQPPTDIAVVDMSGNMYSVYNCKFLNNTLSFGGDTVSSIKGRFSRVIKEREIAKSYNEVSFSFKGIEQFFSLESLVTTFDDNYKSFSIAQGEHTPLSHTMKNGMVISVESMFGGVIQGTNVYNLDISQTKVITVSFPAKKTVDDLLLIVFRIKQYFEFICEQELQIEKVSFCQSEDKYMKSVLVADPILTPKTYVRPVKDRPYIGTPDELIKGLDGWLSSFDKFKDVISIWEKTIYNVNVSQDDLFIWRSQAFELICTLEDAVYEKAQERMAPDQKEPNLRNFMSAVSSIYNLLPNIDVQYFGDAKEVRDKLTHHNPKKNITEDQKKNSYTLIKYFLVSIFVEIFGISGVSRSLILLSRTKN